MTAVYDQAEALRELVAAVEAGEVLEPFLRSEVEPAIQPASTMNDDIRLLSHAIEFDDLDLAPTRSGARVLAVTSGKGGVGKTNMSVNLAIALTKMGQRVLLIDGDIGTANADVICNLRANSMNLSHVVAGKCQLSETIVDAPGGFQIIPGASGLTNIAAMGETERQRLINQMRRLEQKLDVMIVDTGAGVGPNVMGFLAGSDQQLVVTTPEPTAITDAYAIIKAMSLQGSASDVRLLVNMVRHEREGIAVFQRIQHVCKEFLDLNIWYAGHVLQDVNVANAVRRRKPFLTSTPYCEASFDVQQLAKRLVKNLAAQSRGGLMRRMFKWFAR